MLLKFCPFLAFEDCPLTLIFALCSRSDCFGKYGAGHRDTVQAKENHPLDCKRWCLCQLKL